MRAVLNSQALVWCMLRGYDLMRYDPMKKLVTPSVLALLLISLSGCASYNSIAPEWAQIGAENSETTAEDSKAESDADEDVSTWWNPLSWF